MSKFLEYGLKEEILQALEEIGFETPTPIQAESIPFLLESKNNLIARAQTGTGKTDAFGLPILQQINLEEKITQSLILSPTRELALQIANDLKTYAKNIKGLRVTAVYGGANIDTQIKDLKRGAHIVVGTPGRALDLIKRKRLVVENIRYLVLDEADEMLNMGFKDELDAILATTPEDKQNLLFSATMPAEMKKIAKKYMKEAHEITVSKQNIGASTVNHQYYLVQSRDRYQAIKRIVDFYPDIYGIVFCRTRRETKEIADKLMADGYNADALHGDLSQAQRDYVMNRFRKGQIQLLIATDVAARGLDVNDLTHVINYNLPDDPEVYVHRSGRTGRAGKEGISVSIIHLREKGKLRQIERMVSKKFERKLVPLGEEICEKQLFNLIDRMQSVKVQRSQIEQYLPSVYEKLEGLSREELIQGFVSLEFNRFLQYYKGAVDINVSEKEAKRADRSDRNSGRSKNSRGRRNFQRFFINIGEKDGLQTGELLAIVSKNVKNRDAKIGKIDVMKSFSFFEVDKDFTDNVLNGFSKANWHGLDLNVEIAQERKGKRRSGGGGRRKRF